MTVESVHMYTIQSCHVLLLQHKTIQDCKCIASYVGVTVESVYLYACVYHVL